MEFRKAHIWAAQFEVMKVFVSKMKKENKKAFCVKTERHIPHSDLGSVITALGWSQGARHKLKYY